MSALDPEKNPVISIPPAVKCASDSTTTTSTTTNTSSVSSPTDGTFSSDEKLLRVKVSPVQVKDLEAQVYKKKRLAPIRYFILDIYRRLFTLAFCANVAVFIAVMTADRKLLALVNATAANLLACGLARQPLVVNAIFRVVCSVPRSAPLRLRRLVAKAHHYGGVHSGCGVASFVWYVGFVGLLSREYWFPGSGKQTIITVAPVVLAYIILVLLLAIIIVAYPTFRSKRHDYFELTHRFSCWLVVVLFVALLFIFCHDFSQAQGQQQPFGEFLIKLPAFWFLVVTVVAIIHPWLLLRKVRVEPEYLSSHAVRLHFDYTTTSFGKGIQLSKHPLQDWHGFATFPDPEGKTFSCLVSKAGDWTAACIKDQPTHLWKRGILTHGFAYVMRVFNRVIIVTTGSGIGPCLSFLGDENRPDLRVVWQTRSPLKTYGQKVLDLVAQMDKNAVVLDTDQSGRVDMVPIIRRLVGEHDAEAVCVVSNPFLTGKIVYELEETGIPAFGPIFDS